MSSAKSLGVSVYDLDNILVQLFPSRVQAAKWLGVSDMTVLKYIRSGNVLNSMYILKNTPR
jgi:hypothetical protein